MKTRYKRTVKDHVKRGEKTGMSKGQAVKMALRKTKLKRRK